MSDTLPRAVRHGRNSLIRCLRGERGRIGKPVTIRRVPNAVRGDMSVRTPLGNREGGGHG